MGGGRGGSHLAGQGDRTDRVGARKKPGEDAVVQESEVYLSGDVFSKGHGWRGCGRRNDRVLRGGGTGAAAGLRAGLDVAQFVGIAAALVVRSGVVDMLLHLHVGGRPQLGWLVGAEYDAGLTRPQVPGIPRLVAGIKVRSTLLDRRTALAVDEPGEKDRSPDTADRRRGAHLELVALVETEGVSGHLFDQPLDLAAKEVEDGASFLALEQVLGHLEAAFLGNADNAVVDKGQLCLGAGFGADDISDVDVRALDQRLGRLTGAGHVRPALEKGHAADRLCRCRGRRQGNADGEKNHQRG